jgi:hypothetical protein
MIIFFYSCSMPSRHGAHKLNLSASLITLYSSSRMWFVLDCIKYIHQPYNKGMEAGCKK